MAKIVPPYLNKMVDKLKKEYHSAQKNKLKAQKNYEFAVEYEKLCKERLDEALKDNENETVTVEKAKQIKS